MLPEMRKTNLNFKGKRIKEVWIMKVFRIEIKDEFEADIFANILAEEGIPHAVIGNESLVYNGLFKMTMGWGFIEIPEKYKDRTLNLYSSYKESLKE